MPRHWLMKTEPETFGIADLERVKVEPWTGVRSAFARFHMRAMNVGDEVLFYHSSCEPPGVAGLARVVKTRVVDETQFDPASPYFDEKATREKPIWDCVEVEYVKALPRLVSLAEIRTEPALRHMILLRQGRLSVQPVTDEEYRIIVAMADRPAPAEPPRSLKPKPPKKKRARPAKKPVARKNKAKKKR
jgi:predicted RNA-binding protein with PUA-like domain